MLKPLVKLFVPTTACVARGHQEDVTTGDPGAGSWQLGAPHPLPILGMFIILTMPMVGALSRTWLERISPC